MLPLGKLAATALLLLEALCTSEERISRYHCYDSPIMPVAEAWHSGLCPEGTLDAWIFLHLLYEGSNVLHRGIPLPVQPLSCHLQTCTRLQLED